MNGLTIGPAVWPGAKLALQPGDLTQFAPGGMNLGAPPVMMPWDTLESAAATGGYYALQPRGPHPIRDAPLTDAAGGTVYFDNGVDGDRLATLFAIMDVACDPSEFAAFYAESKNPPEDRFLAQVRIVSPSALAALFGAAPVPELVAQPFSVGAALAKFVHAECERLGTRMGGNDGVLDGTFGGDGDWAEEKLCFGFMVENAYHGVYRIWSRAWLVTK